jgi:RNA polymerase sigma-70 factor (ECF subfamily)
VAQPGTESVALPQPLVTELYGVSRAASFGLTRQAFADVLAEVVRKHSVAVRDAGPERLAEFVRGLRLEELALARACAAGHEKAWEVFLTRYRERLYDSARSITREESSARELADSIYADLYGITQRDGRRLSKLEYYTGRGSMEGWLRTVLAQEWINRYRRGKKLVSLDEEAEEGVQFAAPEPTNGAAAAESVVIVAVDAALAALGAEDRYILSAYFLDERTLADIGRVLKVHESTISRRVERIAVNVRNGILDRLVAGGMSRRQAEEAMELDVRDLNVDIRARLEHTTSDLTGGKLQDVPPKTF